MYVQGKKEYQQLQYDIYCKAIPIRNELIKCYEEILELQNMSELKQV
jgi:hypothetical protein